MIGPIDASESKVPAALDRPRRSVGLIACSLGVIAACITTVSLLLARLAYSGDPSSLIVCLILAGLVLLLGLQQYRAVYRGNIRASFQVSVGLLLLGGLFFLDFLSHLLYVAGNSRPVFWGQYLVPYSPLLAIASGLLLTALGNLRWLLVLKAARDRGDLIGRFRFTLTELLLMMTAVAVTAGLAAWFKKLM